MADIVLPDLSLLRAALEAATTARDDASTELDAAAAALVSVERAYGDEPTPSNGKAYVGARDRRDLAKLALEGCERRELAARTAVESGEHAHELHALMPR